MMPSADLPQVMPGDLIDNKYRVQGVLGVGGTALVVSALHEQLGHLVALKLLMPWACVHADAAARFVREGQAAVKLTSEHVARVFDVGALSDGTPYLVMEHLDGEDLSTWLEKRGPLPVEQAVAFVLQACAGVAEAHRFGIIHRDIKPANLFCVQRADGGFTIKVLDFGLAKVADTGQEAWNGVTTQAGTVMGSPVYMCPEQMVGAGASDARTDVWALGVTLYEILAGQTPFEGTSLVDIAKSITMDAPRSLRTFRIEVSPELEAVVLTCLEKDPSRRFPDTTALAHALRPFASQHGSSWRPVPSDDEVQAAMTPASPPTTGASSGRPARRKLATPSMSARRWAGAALAIGTLLIVLAGVRSRVVASANLTAPGLPAASLSSAPTVAAPTHVDSDRRAARDAEIPVSAQSSEPVAVSPIHRPDVAIPMSNIVKPRPRTSKPECDPSYTLDDLGRKHFKPECF